MIYFISDIFVVVVVVCCCTVFLSSANGLQAYNRSRSIIDPHSHYFKKIINTKEINILVKHP